MLKTCLVLLASSLVSMTAMAQVDPVLAPTSFQKIYFPTGFDSNDHVQIVGEGLFPDSCYKPAPAEVKVDEKNKMIVLAPRAYHYQGLYCLQYIVKYDRVVDLGILKAGKWKIFQGNPAVALGEIDIRQATTDAPDDYLYAPVSQAFFHQTNAKKEVLLTGEFTNDCMVLDRVLVNFEKEAIVLQPVARIETRSNCQQGQFPFTHNVDVNTLNQGRYLLHVRSMNGNAINTLVDVN